VAPAQRAKFIRVYSWLEISAHPCEILLSQIAVTLFFVRR